VRRAVGYVLLFREYRKGLVGLVAGEARGKGGVSAAVAGVASGVGGWGVVEIGRGVLTVE